MMSTIASFLRHVFSVQPISNTSNRRATTCLDVTLHDAMRLQQSALVTDDAYDRFASSHDDNSIEIFGYGSEAKLREILRRFDHQHATCLTIVLVLSDVVQGDLLSLIQRTHRADRLVLVSQRDWLAKSTSFGDVAMAAPRIGWGQIEREFTVQQAIKSARRTLPTGGSLVVVMPSNFREQRPLM